MKPDRAKFFADTPFVKSVEGDSGDLLLKGYASTWTLDRDQEYVERGAFDGTIEKYLHTNPILLWQHNLEQPIGIVKSMDLDETGLDVQCHVPRPDDREPDWAHLAYNKIKGGIVKTFSIGGFFDRTQKGAKRAITAVDLFEISVVSVPSNPDSIFAAAVKSLAGGARPELTAAHTSQMAQILGMSAITDPEIAMMTEDEKGARYEFLAEIYRKTGKRPPQLDAWRKVVNEKGKPVLERLDTILSLKSQVDGREFAEKAAASVSLTKPQENTLRDAVEGAEKALEDLEDAIEKITGIDFDQGEPEEPGESNDEAGKSVKAVTLTKPQETSLRNAVEAAEQAMEDLEDAIEKVTGIDFDAGEPEEPGESNDEAGKSLLDKLADAKESLGEARTILGDGKRGRVLSRRNEAKLRKMREEIDTILAQISEEAGKDEGEEGKSVEGESSDES